MYNTPFDPSWWWRCFAGSASCGGRRFYTKAEKVEELQKLKKRLEKEMAGIDELIADLKK